jgi:pyruvyl transferase EpsO
LLDRLGCQVRYQSNYASFDPRALGRAHPDGPILINGGGNFGDLYAGQQGARERVLRELRDRRIIQLPQSIHFRDMDNTKRVSQLIAAHGNVTLMLREDRSFDFAREHFDADLVRCPDMAFGLGSLSRPVAPRVDVAWIARPDHDVEWRDPGPMPVRSDSMTFDDVDWTGTLGTEQLSWTGRSRRLLAVNQRLMSDGEPSPLVRRWAWRALASTFEPLAQVWVDRGLGLISGGRVVVTDRLHGHILALLLDVPHVILDNATGKVRSTFETWTSPAPNAIFADSAEDALRAARRLLESDATCSS